PTGHAAPSSACWPSAERILFVIPGPDPGIHVDGRVKLGHDEMGNWTGAKILGRAVGRRGLDEEPRRGRRTPTEGIRPAGAAGRVKLGHAEMGIGPGPRILVEPIVRAALIEDLGRAGDITTDAIVPAEARVEAVITSRQPGVLAGLEAGLLAFELLDPGLDIE